MNHIISASSIADTSQSANLDNLRTLCAFARTIQDGFFDAEEKLRLELTDGGTNKKSIVWTSKLAIRRTNIEVTRDKRCTDILDVKYVKLSFVRRVLKGYSDRIRYVNGKYNAEQMIGIEMNRVSKEFEPIVREYVEYVNHYNEMIDRVKNSLVQSSLGLDKVKIVEAFPMIKSSPDANDHCGTSNRSMESFD